MSKYYEKILLRFEGGPLHGDHMSSTESHFWPFPEALGAFGEIGPVWGNSAHYEKLSESQLPEQEEDSPLIRGVTYVWTPAS